MSGQHGQTAAQVSQALRDAAFEDLQELIARYEGDNRSSVRAACASARRRLEREGGERRRVKAMYELEWELSDGGVCVGVDEVGRGAVAGPLTVCAVCLPTEPLIWGINDSKQLSAARREQLCAEIREHARGIGIAHVSASVIDELGMSRALRMGMSSAIKKCGLSPDTVLIDGNPVHVHPKERCLVKGDARVASIACASIVAKVTRDALMVELGRRYPAYGWDACKGYASAQHREAIRAYGLTPLHRASFCGGFVDTLHLFE